MKTTTEGRNPRLTQGLAALGMIIATIGTLLPWPVSKPPVPGALYVREATQVPSAYHLDDRLVGPGGRIVILAAIPVLATLSRTGHLSGMLLVVAAGATAVSAVYILSYRGSALGPWVALAGVAVQFMAVAWTAVLREVRA